MLVKMPICPILMGFIESVPVENDPQWRMGFLGEACVDLRRAFRRDDLEMIGRTCSRPAVMSARSVLVVLAVQYPGEDSQPVAYECVGPDE